MSLNLNRPKADGRWLWKLPFVRPPRFKNVWETASSLFAEWWKERLEAMFFCSFLSFNSSSVPESLSRFLPHMFIYYFVTSSSYSYRTSHRFNVRRTDWFGRRRGDVPKWKSSWRRFRTNTFPMCCGVSKLLGIYELRNWSMDVCKTVQICQLIPLLLLLPLAWPCVFKGRDRPLCAKGTFLLAYV